MSEASTLRAAYVKVRAHGLRYSAVSVVNVIVGQGLLFVFVRAFERSTDWSNDIAWTVANLLAVSLSAIPAYYLNRIWVWGKRGRSQIGREVLPFWGFALAGLLLSTVAVNVAANLTEVKLVANVANIAAFGTLWVAKFFVFDAFMFGKGHHGPAAPGEVDDLADPAAGDGTH